MKKGKRKVLETAVAKYSQYLGVYGHHELGRKTVNYRIVVRCTEGWYIHNHRCSRLANANKFAATITKAGIIDIEHWSQLA